MWRRSFGYGIVSFTRSLERYGSQSNVFFFQLVPIWWMVTLSSCLISQRISFILPPNEKKNHLFRWSSFWPWRETRLFVVTKLFSYWFCHKPCILSVYMGSCAVLLTLMVFSILQRRWHLLTRCIKKIADQPCYNEILYLRRTEYKY